MMQQACHAAVPVSCRYVRTEYLPESGIFLRNRLISNKIRLELHGRHLPLQIQGVIAKSIDVLDPVGRQAAQDSCVNEKSLSLNLLEHLGHRLHVVQDDQVGDQLVT
jgi:hypothetical protein